MTLHRRPRWGFVGPHLGRHPGWVTTQSEVLAELFERSGHAVRSTSSIRPALPRLLDTLRALARWRRQEEGGVDVVVISVFSGRAFTLGDAASRWASRLGLPQIHWLHGGDLPALADRRPGRVRALLARARAVVAPSPYLTRSLSSLGLEAEVIPNVLDLGDYTFRLRREPHRPPRILWMRTFHPLYRPELALEAFARLRSADPRYGGARLTLAGQDKGSLTACRDLVRRSGLEDAVALPGFLGPEAKRRAFAEHDVFWNTNAVDNTPVTVLEAMASGLPVVALAAGGLPDLLGHGEAGRLVAECTPDGMAEATRALLEEPAEVARLSRRGRKLALESSWPRVERRWLELVDRLGIPVTPAGGAGKPELQ